MTPLRFSFNEPRDLRRPVLHDLASHWPFCMVPGAGWPLVLVVSGRG
ncbi:hypothetical protein [Paraburkholderia megapolitana]